MLDVSIVRTCTLSIINYIYVIVFSYYFLSPCVFFNYSNFCDPKLILQETDKGFRFSEQRKQDTSFLIDFWCFFFFFLLSLMEDKKGACNLRCKKKRDKVERGVKVTSNQLMLFSIRFVPESCDCFKLSTVPNHQNIMNSKGGNICRKKERKTLWLPWFELRMNLIITHMTPKL